MSNGYFIATFSGNVKNHKYLANCKRWSDFERIFDPQRSTRVSYAKGKNFNFRHFWRPSWILAEKKSVNISKTERDRAISSEFLTHMVVIEQPIQRGKISLFATFVGHLGFLRKMKKFEYLENRKR